VDLRATIGVLVAVTPAWAQGVPEPHAVQLTEKARVAAKAGRCEVVAKYDPQVHDLDGLYYETVFQTDPAIEACLDMTPLTAPSARSLHGGCGREHRHGPRADLRAAGWWSTGSDCSARFVPGIQNSDNRTTSSSTQGGVRLWLGSRVFLDGRSATAKRAPCQCTSGGDPCTKHGVGFWAGWRRDRPRRSLRAELHVELDGGGGTGMLGAGIGASFY